MSSRSSFQNVLLTFVLLSGVLSSSISYGSREISAEVKAQINHQWDEVEQTSPGRKALLFLPRLLGRPLTLLVQGQVAHRVKNTFLLYREGGRLERATNSILNPLATANDAVSDLVGALKSPKYALLKRSRRIQICTGMTTVPIHVYLVNPLLHSEISVDGMDELDQPLGSQNCQPVYLSSQESESLALERLALKSVDIEGELTLCSNNCGGIAHDRLKTVGLGFPIFPNFGIGNEVTTPCAKWGRSLRIEDEIRNTNENLLFFRQILMALEQGRDLSGIQREWLLQSATFHSVDAYLQFVISAARGKNAKNRDMIVEVNDYPIPSGSLVIHPIRWNVYWSQNGSTPKIKSSMKKMLKRMFVGIDAEAYQWLRDTYGETEFGPARIYPAVYPEESLQFAEAKVFGTAP